MPAAEPSPALPRPSPAGSLAMIRGNPMRDAYQRHQAQTRQEDNVKDQQFLQVLKLAAQGQGDAAQALAERYRMPLTDSHRAIIRNARAAGLMKTGHDLGLDKDPEAFRAFMQAGAQNGYDPTRSYLQVMQNGPILNPTARMFRDLAQGGGAQGVGTGAAGGPSVGTDTVTGPAQRPALERSPLPIQAQAPEPLRDTIAATAQQYGIDAEVLTRLLQTESNWDPMARSPAGAAGLAQFMPGTAQQYGVDVTDAHSSIDGAGHYLSDMTTQFDGNPVLGAMAYNWGPGNVQKWLASGADPARVPAETRAYVRDVLGQDVGAVGGRGVRPGQTAPAEGAQSPQGASAQGGAGLSRDMLVALQYMAQTDPKGAQKWYLDYLVKAEGIHAATAAMKEYHLAQRQGFQGSFLDFEAERAASRRSAAPQIREGINPETGDPMFGRIDPRTGAVSPLQGITPRPRTSTAPHASTLVNQAQTRALARAKADAPREGGDGLFAGTAPDPAKVRELYQQYLAEELRMRGIDPTAYTAGADAPQSTAPPSPPQDSPPGQPTAPAPPKVGDTVLGYRFLGGDPAQESSWESVE